MRRASRRVKRRARRRARRRTKTGMRVIEKEEEGTCVRDASTNTPAINMHLPYTSGASRSIVVFVRLFKNIFAEVVAEVNEDDNL